MKTTVLFILLFMVSLRAVEYRVDAAAENRVAFTSDAPVEQIVGVTSKIDGYVLWGENDLTNNSEFYFEVDLASLDTGIGLRNRHMRENYLETDKHPFVSYKGKITEATTNGDNSIAIKTSGTFSLHGIEKIVDIHGTLTKTMDGYKATSQFVVALADFNIKRPQLMLLRIGETIQLDVLFFAKEFKQ